MGRSYWIKIAAGCALVLTMVGTQCRSSSKTQVINAIRICGDVFEKDRVPMQKTEAMVKLRIKGTQYSFNKSGGMPFETVDQLAIGENVRLDNKGRFCTGIIKLENYYKPTSTKILNLAVMIGGLTVEGYLADGDLGGSDKTTLHLFAKFNIAKPYDATTSRFLTEDLHELFGVERKMASKLEAVSNSAASGSKRVTKSK